jgi:nicotinamidase-related amidase
MAGAPATTLAEYRAALPAAERDTYRAAGYAHAFGVGESPALVVVDVEYGFTGVDPRQDLMSSIATYSDSCGPYAWAAIPRLRALADAFRERGLPVAFSHSRDTEEMVTSPRPSTALVAELGAGGNDLVFAKDAASAFFDTELADQLRAREVDTVVVCGCVTSGCVRATVVDAAAHRFKVVVVEECVFDRAITPHLANLFDMDSKYADVWPLSRTVEYLSSLPVGGGVAKGGGHG